MIWFFLWLACSVTAGEANRRPDPRSLPNVVLMLADDMGWGDLGCYNPHSRIPTPHMDRLAAEGMRFTDAHAPSAVCTPTRYGLMTGRYAWRTRLKQGVLWGYSPPLIEPERLTLPAFLREVGYTTACVGKWHLGLGWVASSPAAFGDLPKPAADPGLIQFEKPLTAGPHTLGFDFSFVLPASLDMDPYVFVQDGRVVGLPVGRLTASRHQRQGGAGFWREGPSGSGFTPESCLPELVAQSENWITRCGGRRPFFLYVPLTSPHDPWVPTVEYRGKSKAGARGDFVMQTDAAVGRILAALDRAGSAKDTLVIVTSDNGAHWLPEEVERTGHAASGPWRGQKSDIWEGGHRVPFLVRWPGHVRAGSTSDALIGLQDVMATLADVVGRPLPLGAGEDSQSFSAALLGKRLKARRPQVLHSIQGIFAVRDGPWKLIEGQGSGGWTSGRVSEPGQLYHLGRDPQERHNLWNERPREVARLARVLEGIRNR